MKLTLENIILNFENIQNIKLFKYNNKKYFSENGRTFNITKLNGVVETEKQFKKYNDIYYENINSKDKKYFNKYFNILDRKYYYLVEVINDFGEVILEFKNINIKVHRDKIRSFFNDCLHYINKIIALYESGEKSIDVLCGEIEGKHNDLYVIANVKEYNLLPNFKGGECTEHILGRMNTLLAIFNGISNKIITDIDIFRIEVYAKSKFIKTPSKFNTEISTFQNNKYFESKIYIDILKKYCELKPEDEKILKSFIDKNKININKKMVIVNIINNKNYLKEFINKNYLKIL